MKKIIVILFVLSIVLITIEYNFFDESVAKWAFSHEYDFIHDSAKMLSNAADATYFLIISVLLFLYFYFIKKNLFIASRVKFFILSIVASGIVVNVVKFIFGRSRPYMLKNKDINTFDFFTTNYNYLSFPSGHTTTAFAIAMSLSLMFPRYALLFFLYAFIMAYSRVACYMHYISDVTAGAFVGVATTLLLYIYKKTTFQKDTKYE